MSEIFEEINCRDIEYSSRKREWYKNGKWHRDDDLPAIEYATGTKEWYKNGKRHRENDMPAIEYANGNKEWYLNGKRHRENGPAIEKFDGTKRWFIYGIRINEISIKILKKRAHNHKLRKLLKLRKNELFWQWYFHPDNIGGKLAHKQIKEFFEKL